MTGPVRAPSAEGMVHAAPLPMSPHGARHAPTGADVSRTVDSAGLDPAGPDLDDRVRIESSLQRIAALHGELARQYGILVEEVGIRLAGRAESSLTATMPVKPRNRKTPTRREAEDATLMAAGELAEALQCHPRTLRRMELRGELPPPIRKGRLKRWRRQEIQTWLDSRSSPRPGRRSSR